MSIFNLASQVSTPVDLPVVAVPDENVSDPFIEAYPLENSAAFACRIIYYSTVLLQARPHTYLE